MLNYLDGVFVRAESCKHAFEMSPMSPKRRKVLEDWPPAFWDNLSKLFITPRSLKEFDRRTASASQILQPISGEVKEECILPLKRFARLGGPDLDDLHFVIISRFSYAYTSADDCLVYSSTNQKQKLDC